MNKRIWVVLALVFCLVLSLSLAGCRAVPEGPETASPPPVQSESPAPQTGEPSDEPVDAPSEAPAETPTADPKGNTESLDENGSYDSVNDVALYLRLYGELPDNYITKNEAEALGWSGGSVERYAPGKAIGGDRFSNREGLLPKANGRTWTECDIDTLGENSRGAKRLVYSNDGLIYYTDDHYESFQRLYPEE